METRHYPKAPIIEAVIEFRFESDLEMDEIKTISNSIKNFYPNQEDKSVNKIEFKIDLTKKNSSHARVDPSDKIQIKSLGEYRDKICIVSPKNIIISQLPPYIEWKDFRKQAETVWDASYKTLGYRKLKQIGMRYINRVDIPFDENEQISFEKYFNLHINIPSQFPDIHRFKLEFESDIQKIKCSSRINSSTVDAALIGHGSFILDIDIVRIIDVPQKKTAIFELLDQMRSAKNEMFEASITDQARSLFYGE